jgi:RimJ/RimL family protein N-acetyltransferase
LRWRDLREKQELTMILRDVSEADLPVLFEYQREPRAVQMAVFPPREREAFMQHWRDNVLGNPSGLAKAIVVDDAVVGHIVSWQGEGLRLVGYWIGEAYWGRGIASAALAAFLREHERTRPLHAFVAIANRGSRRVLEKCGFQPDGKPSEAPDGVTELRMALA